MSESFEINIKTLSDTKAVKALQDALSKISGVLASFITVSDKSTFTSKNQSEQFDTNSSSVDKNTQSQIKNQEQQEKSKQSQDDNTQSSQKQSTQFKETRNQVDLLSSAFQGMGISIGMLATNGLAKIPSLIKNSLGEYAQAEVLQVRLQSVLESTNQAYGSNLEKLKDLASQMEILTNADGKQVLEMESVAVAMGVSAEQMEEVMKGAVGLSKAYNMDLSLAVKASAAAIQGKTDLLARYIPTLSELTNEEEKLAEVQNKQAIGYQAAIDEMQTFQGSMTALRNSLGALSEVFGEAFSSRVQTLANTLSSLARKLEENKEWVIGTTKVFSTFIGLLLAKKILNFTARITGLTLAFRKVSIASALSGKSMNIFAKSVVAAKVATNGLSVAFKGFLKSTVALAAISFAFEGLCWVVDKLRNNTIELTDEQKNLQIALEKTAKASQNLAKTEQSRIEKLGLSEDEFAKKTIEISEKLVDIHERGLEAREKGLNTDAISEELKTYTKLLKVLDENKQKYIEIYNIRNNENLSQAELIKEQALSKLKASELSNEEKLSSLEAEQATLLKTIETAEKSKLSIKGEIALEDAKNLDNAVNRLLVLRQEIGALDSALKLEDERTKRAKAQLDLERQKQEEAQKSFKNELDLLQAKADGDKNSIVQIEKRIALSNLAKKIEASGIAMGQEAIEKARQKLDLEEEISKKQLAITTAQAKEEFLAEYKIIKARADGDETLARTLELQKEATSLADKLGIEYNEALNALKNLEKAEEARNNKNKDTKVSYDEKDVQRAKKVLEKGVGGSIGQKSIDQAQAIVEGRAIEGKEYAMFSGASKRVKPINEGESQINNQAYDNAQKIAPNISPRGNIVPRQNEALSQQQSGLQNNNITPSQATPTNTQTLAKAENSSAMAQNKEDSNAFDKSASLLAKEIKEVVKKLNETNKILEGNQNLLEDIKNSSNAIYI